MRAALLVVVVFMLIVLFAGCATAPVVADCAVDPPPAALLEVPKPLPPVPADLPPKR